MNSFRKCVSAFLLIVVAIMAIPVSADLEVGGINDDIAAVLNSQLSQEELDVLAAEEYYRGSVSAQDVIGHPVLRLFTEIYWRLADRPCAEWIAEAQKHADSLSFADYIVFGETVFRICVLRGSDHTVQIGDAGDFPAFLKEGLRLPDEIQKQNAKLKNLYCFDGFSSHEGAAVYWETDRGVFVEYYETNDSPGVLFTEGEFREKAAEYYRYLSSERNNYNEQGEAIGVEQMSFTAFLQNKRSAESKTDNTPVIIGIGAVCLAASVLFFLLRRKAKGRRTH